MATYPTAIHLCSGYGGFELALRPWGVRTVAHVERDSYAASILMERMEQKRLDQAPIWDDLTTFDGEPWCGRVDILTAGFPCQPFSNAGARRGLDDDRWLWPSIARIISTVRPRFVVLENVPPVVRAGLPAVLADLAQLGFDAEWGLYSAADIGAPHRRQRWWCVAYAASNRSPTIIGARDSRPDADRSGSRTRPDETEPVAYAGSERLSRVSGIPHGAESENKRRINPNADHIVKRNVEAVADTESKRRQQVTGSALSVQGTDGERTRDHIVECDVKTVADTTSSRWVQDRLYDTGNSGTPISSGVSGNVGLGDSDVADTESARRESPTQQHQQQAITRPAGHRFPPTRDDAAAWSRWITEGGPQPVVRRLADGPPAGLADALHLGGNGLVPQTATAAIQQLLERGGWQL